MKKIYLLLFFVVACALQSRAQSCICLSGPNTVCRGGNATFSVPSGSAASYTWGVTSNLQIISGQGTNSVTVASSTPYTGGYGTVTLQLGDVSCGVSLSYQVLLIDQFQGSISGPNTLCNAGTATFSVPSGSGTTYTWSVSSDLQIASGQGTNSIVVSSSNPYGSGYGTVTVVITNSNGCTATISYQTLHVGPPSNTFTVRQNSSPFCTNSLGNWMTIVQQPLPNVDYFEWGFTEVGNSTPPVVVDSHGNYDEAFNSAFPHAGIFEVYAREGSNCGGLGNTFTCIVEVDDNCGGGGFGSGFAIHPNPANDIVSISAPGKGLTNKINASGSTASTPFNYKVYDLAGKLVKSGKSDGGDVSIDTHNLPAQIYVVNIFMHLLLGYTENEVPQPQVLAALGLLNVNPLAFNPSWKSTCIPAKYKPCALCIKTRIPSMLYSWSPSFF